MQELTNGTNKYKNLDLVEILNKYIKQYWMESFILDKYLEYLYVTGDLEKDEKELEEEKEESRGR